MADRERDLQTDFRLYAQGRLTPIAMSGHASSNDDLEHSLHALEFPLLRQHLSNLAESEDARKRLNLLRPSSEKGWVKEELIRVNEIKGLVETGVKFPGIGLPDIAKFLSRVAIVGAVLAAEEINLILHHLRVHRNLRRILDHDRTRIPHVYRFSRSIKPMRSLEEQIEKIITPEAAIRDKASPLLVIIRKDLAVIQSDLRKRISGIAARYARQGVLSGDTFTLRDGRYVLPINSGAMGKIKGIIHDRSASGGTMFIEPSSIIPIGNELRTKELAERDEIRRILALLSEDIRLNLPQIEGNLSSVVSLDCLWAKALLSVKLDAVPATLTDTNVLRIFKGRHPLLVLAKERDVVPLDFELGEDWICLVISGPNAGGKSVALKCIGLLSVMTACGLHIPTLPGTEIPMYNDFQAVIGDEQSISDDLSTFSAHMVRLKGIMKTASTKTLVLVDEIGAGTDPQEGASLSVAVLNRLITAKVPTVVTTHHGVLKAFANSTDGCTNGSMAFDQKTLTPTYRFNPHLPGSSYALEIARRVGVPEDVIDEARTVLGEDRTKLDDLIIDLTEKARKYESLLSGQQDHVTSSENAVKRYQEKLIRLEAVEKDLKKRAKQKIEAVERAGRKRIETLVREIQEEKASRKSITTAQKKLKTFVKDENYEGITDNIDEEIQSEMEIKSLADGHEDGGLNDSGKTPERGDWVTIDDSNSKGEVMEVSERQRRVCVAVGSVQLWINFDRVKVVRPPTPPAKKVVFAKLPDVPFELDVRGLDAVEALERVDRYLFDGAATSREKLGIIHGKGAGVLSKRVRKMLHRHKVVDSYRFGEYGEGDYGVTIVTLKKG